MYIHVRMCVCTYVYIYVYASYKHGNSGADFFLADPQVFGNASSWVIAHTSGNIHIYKHTLIHKYTYIYLRIDLATLRRRMHISKHTHIYQYTYMYTCIELATHIHTHTHTPTSLQINTHA